MALSPAGDFAAVGGYYGLQIFHFNGEDPATPDGGVLLLNLGVNQVAWDNDHHLYVLTETSAATQRSPSSASTCTQ